MNSHGKAKIAIVIPTFNRANFVTKAIDSALKQTHPCQVIVCDHGSSDNTPEIMKNYSNKIKYIRRESDFGPHFCWLEGVLNTDANYIHIQYDDDWIDKTFIEKTFKLMKDDVGMVFSNCIVVNLDQADKLDMNNLIGALPYPFNQKEKKKKYRRNFKTGIYDNKILEKKCLKKNFMISPAACLFRKKDVIDSLYQGRLPIKSKSEYHGVGPDHFMTLITLLRYKKFGYVNEVLTFFGAHQGSITTNALESNQRKEKLLAAYNEVRKFYKMLKIINKIQKIKDYFNKFFVKKQ